MDAMQPPIQAASLATYLANRDEPCPSCGYNLRGLSGNHCPECNTDLVLRVAIAEPRLGLFLATIVAWALGAGFSVLLLVYIVMMVTFAGRGLPPMREFAPVPCGGTLIEGTVVILLVAYQRRVRRLPRLVRVGLLLLGIGATLLNVGLFTAFVN